MYVGEEKIFYLGELSGSKNSSSISYMAFKLDVWVLPLSLRQQ